MDHLLRRKFCPKIRVTHTLTHTGSGSGSTVWSRYDKSCEYSEQIVPESSRSRGKREPTATTDQKVGGSNPSRRAREPGTIEGGSRFSASCGSEEFECVIKTAGGSLARQFKNWRALLFLPFHGRQKCRRHPSRRATTLRRPYIS